MQIIFKPSKDFLLKPDLEDFFQKKMEKIEKFLKDIKPVKMELEISLSSKRLRKGSLFFAKAQLFLPRKSLRAAGEGRTARKAIIEVRDDLERQVKKYSDLPESRKRSEKKKLEKI